MIWAMHFKDRSNRSSRHCDVGSEGQPSARSVEAARKARREVRRNKRAFHIYFPFFSR